MSVLAPGSPLMAMLMAEQIEPGSAPSYELCKQIYAYHPLGGKIVDSPIQMAQCQKREISVSKGPEERCVEAFWREWEAMGCNDALANFYGVVRIYGIGTLAVNAQGVDREDCPAGAANFDGDLSGCK